jgi:hypothetical protein
MSSVGEQVIENIAKILFDSARLDRNKFQRQARQALRQDFDHYIQPFKLSKEEKETKSNITSIVTANLDPSVDITDLSQGSFVRACSSFSYFW